MKLSKKEQPLAKCGRPFFSENAVNKKYNSRYRNSENTNRLGGKLLELGRATGIVAMGIVTTGIRLSKYEAAEEAHKVFQNEVFAPLVEDPVLQMHLAPKPGQRVQSQ